MSRIFASIFFTLIFVLGFAQTTDNSNIGHGNINLIVTSPYTESLCRFHPKTALISGKDTIWEKNENHVFDNIPFGKYAVYAEAEGLIPVMDSVMVERKEEITKVIIMQDRVIDLQMVIVDGSRPAMIFRNDTLIFTPDGMNFANEDKAREVLKRLPGAEISEEGIKVGGQLIKKTYVDGRTSLFGDNPLTAFDHIEASDVAHIYVYDEPEHPEETRTSRQGMLQRVINIVTKSKMINSIDATGLVGVGPSLGENSSSHRWRYVAGGDYNLFSDDWMLTTNLIANNQNGTNTTPGYYLRTSSPSQNYNAGERAEFSVERKWEKERGFQTSLLGKYGVAHFNGEQASTSETTYQPTSSFAQRFYRAQSSNYKRSTENSANIRFSRSNRRYRINASYELDAIHAKDLSMSNTEDDFDNAHYISGNKIETYHRSRRHSANLLWQLPVKRIKLDLKGSYNNGQSDDDIERNTFYNDDSYDLVIPTSDDNGLLSISAAIHFDTVMYKTDERGRPSVNKAWFNTFTYSLNSDNRDISRIAQDASTHEIDRTNTYTFSNHNITQSLGLEGTLQYFRSNRVLSYNLAFVNNNISDRQTDISGTHFSKNFVTPSASLIFRDTGMKGGWIMLYTVNSAVPNIAQMRTVISDDNPLFINLGNKDLKAGLVQRVKITYNRLYGSFFGSSLAISLSTDQTKDFIASSSTFSKDGCVVDAGDVKGYKVQPGSTIKSFANLSGMSIYGVELLYDLHLSKIKSRFRMQVNESLNFTPFLFNGEKFRQKRNTINSFLNFTTDAIANTHIDLIFRSIFNVAESGNMGGNSRLLDNRLGLKVRTDNIGPGRRLFAEMQYTLYNENYLSTDDVDNQHVMNIYAGAKLKHNLELSITAYDIFNAYSGIRWSLTDNYIQKVFGQNYGRYISLNLKWSLVKVKSNRLVNKPLIY